MIQPDIGTKTEIGQQKEQYSNAIRPSRTPMSRGIQTNTHMNYDEAD
jgi:hypothetical protein